MRVRRAWAGRGARSPRRRWVAVSLPVRYGSGAGSSVIELLPYGGFEPLVGRT